MPGNEKSRPPAVITFVTRDPETEGIAVKHDGKVVFRDPSMGSWDQYFKRIMPKGVPVVLEVDEILTLASPVIPGTRMPAAVRQ